MIFDIYEFIKKQHTICTVDDSVLDSITEEQAASLAYLSLSYKNTDDGTLLRKLTTKHSWINFLIDALHKDEGISIVEKIIRKTYLNKLIKVEEMKNFVSAIVEGSIPLKFVSFWCMEVQQLGFSRENTFLLTKSIVECGSTYNYTDNFPGYFFGRRYPTGGLSEKLALLIPTMLMAFANQYNIKIKTPFLVARSLGFTGGTWNKLSVIPGFSFPNPGEESIEALRTCGISMTISHKDICPADRILYQLRSLSGSVDSVELAAASIASKQLAVSCNYLVLDVRYGEGAFFPKEEAVKLAVLVKELLDSSGISTDINYTNNDFPTGSSIGNCLEVEEAFHILLGNSQMHWNPYGIQEQQKLLCTFLMKIIKNATKEKNNSKLMEAIAAIKKENIIMALKKFLIAHRVSQRTIKDIIVHGGYYEKVFLKFLFCIYR